MHILSPFCAEVLEGTVRSRKAKSRMVFSQLVLKLGKEIISQEAFTIP